MRNHLEKTTPHAVELASVANERLPIENRSEAPALFHRVHLASEVPNHQIVIVGGGAGGLELATKLGDLFFQKDKRRENINTILVDRCATHVWKPLLHKVAAGSLEVSAQQTEYLAQAHRHHFSFQQGELITVDRHRKTILLERVTDDNGFVILPQREIRYDTLVLAVGSVTNFFDVPGAAEHAITIDTAQQAEYFRQRLIHACMLLQNGIRKNTGAASRIHIVIIGGGATGVELAAELRSASEVLSNYGLYKFDPIENITITVVDSGRRILSQLPQEMTNNTQDLLKQLHIEILSGEQVSTVRADAVLTASGNYLPSDITIWTAGIKIPAIVADLGLPTNRLGQLLVTQSLRSQGDENIFAIGDCANCPWPQHEHGVPPLAQAAHQQASAMVEILRHRLERRPLPQFHYHDHGTLLSLGERNALGELGLKGHEIKIRGFLARFVYFSLYRMHVLALHGLAFMTLDTAAQWLRGKTIPPVKLH